jgi:hypothetical protein
LVSDTVTAVVINPIGGVVVQWTVVVIERTVVVVQR